jgi:catechol 2,3-dioxygenase-like lactoylglutathione lyase family enzyme
MNQFISSVAVVVCDYDEAIEYYTKQLGFELVADDDLGNGKRWVQVAPQGAGGTRLFWREPRRRNNWLASGTRRVAGCFCFVPPTIFGGTFAR